MNENPANIKQTADEGRFIAKPVDPATKKEYDRCAYALFAGSELEAYEPELAVKLYDSLHFQIPDVGVLFADCSAADADDLRSSWESLGEPTLLVACPECMAKLREELPQIPAESLYEKLLSMGISGGCCHESYIVFEDDENVRTLAEDMGVETQARPENEAEAEYPYLTCSMNERNRLRREGIEAVHILELIYGMGVPGLPDKARLKANQKEAEELMKELYFMV